LFDNRYTILKKDHPHALPLLLWICAISAGLYVYFFRHQWLQEQITSASGASPIWLSVVYLALGCIRGFTLVPATHLVVAGMVVLPPVRLYLLTLGGIIVSSASVYRFAEAMHFDRFFERRYPSQVAKLRALMARRELPIVIAWSFLPIAPTDLVCYVCGALKVDLKKCLMGVVIGEGAICAIYIYLGRLAITSLAAP
jgi:uncharacterized membrane protein YdjX (TVP38/TMEM64 family)